MDKEKYKDMVISKAHKTLVALDEVTVEFKDLLKAHEQQKLATESKFYF